MGIKLIPQQLKPAFYKLQFLLIALKGD